MIGIGLSTSPRRHPIGIINNVAPMASCQTFPSRVFDSALPSCQYLVIDIPSLSPTKIGDQYGALLIGDHLNITEVLPV